jgi:hypothetical protein
VDEPLHPDFEFTPEQRLLAMCVDCDHCRALFGDDCTSPEGWPLPMMVGGIHFSRVRKGQQLLRP